MQPQPDERLDEAGEPEVDLAEVAVRPDVCALGRISVAVVARVH